METVKVMPWADGQGDYVLINQDDFNPDVHKLYAEPQAKTKQATAKPQAEAQK